VEYLEKDAAALLRQNSYPVVVRYPNTDQAVPHRTSTKEQKCKKMLNDAGEPAPEDFVILKNCHYHEMLLNRESNPGLPRLVGVNDKRKS
jgi:hypothetical protein